MTVFADSEKWTHHCEASGQSDHGEAVTYCIEDERGLTVGNGEYSSLVRFCPFCGYGQP